jgi:hypothetical protein
MIAVDHCKTKGNIDKTDGPTLAEGLQRLYKELFSQYKELAEGDIMLSEKLDFYGDKYREEGEKKAKLEVAKNFFEKLQGQRFTA